MYELWTIVADEAVARCVCQSIMGLLYHFTCLRPAKTVAQIEVLVRLKTLAGIQGTLC